MEIPWKHMIFVFWLVQLSYCKVLDKDKPCRVILGQYFFYDDYDQCLELIKSSSNNNENTSMCKHFIDRKGYLTVNCPYIPDRSPTTQSPKPKVPEVPYSVPDPSQNKTYNHTSSKYSLIEPPVCGISNSLDYRIVGGDQAKKGAWPWVAALGYHNTTTDDLDWHCSGSVISEMYVLTAAHCVHKHPELRVVRLGEHDFDDEEEKVKPIDVKIKKRIIHPNFNMSTNENDIALLKLKRKIKFSDRIRPICLPFNLNIKDTNLIRKEVYIAGWGQTSYKGPKSRILQEVKFPIWSENQCRKAFVDIGNVHIDNRTLCAGETGKDACQGDSGGSLMYSFKGAFYSIGITSVGFKCAEPGFPGIYTKLTEFVNFTLSNMK